ncbi:hypothetical protein TNCV_4567401 [Trichonephila clavipes]|nr:hypothetical protein TNCV_4567401 [Trichonephila clavipes]
MEGSDCGVDPVYFLQEQIRVRRIIKGVIFAGEEVAIGELSKEKAKSSHSCFSRTFFPSASVPLSIGEVIQSLLDRFLQVESELTLEVSDLVCLERTVSLKHCSSGEMLGGSRRWFAVSVILYEGILSHGLKCSRCRRINGADVNTPEEVDQHAVSGMEAWTRERSRLFRV